MSSPVREKQVLNHESKQHYWGGKIQTLMTGKLNRPNQALREVVQVARSAKVAPPSLLSGAKSEGDCVWPAFPLTAMML